MGQSNTYNTLYNQVRRMPGLWFGVVDGAQVDDVVSALKQTDLRHQPLYIGLNDKPEQLKTAPFMVWLNHEDDTAESLPDEQFLWQFHHIVADGKISAGVLWKCNAGADVLYRHLRSLNKVIIPLEEDGVLSSEKTETVVFRHADANVLCQVLPVLPANNLARILGGADYVAFGGDREWGDMAYHLSAEPHWPEPDKGFLHFDAATYERITQNRYKGLIRKVESYLDKVAPEPKPEAEELKRIAAASFYEAKENGIKTEAGFYRWAYFYLITAREFIHNEDVQACLDMKAGASMDERLKNLMIEVIEKLQGGQREV